MKKYSFVGIKCFFKKGELIMIVEKNGYILIYTQKGDVSLHDYTGQCIFRKKVENMNKEKALNIIANFSSKGIFAVC